MEECACLEELTELKISYQHKALLQWEQIETMDGIN